MTKKTFFLGGLNELRTIAAIAVIFHHIELFKHRDGLPSLYDIPLIKFFISNLGKNAVYLFFVLSGFLITLLLLREYDKFKTINLSKFYLRRIFRIWPLYYIIIIISFLLIPLLAKNFEIFELTPYYYSKIINPNLYTNTSILLYITFLPNFVENGVVGAAQTWSIGVEEQFYIIWPLLLLLFMRNRKIGLVLMILTLLLILTKIIPISIAKWILLKIPVYFMAIGAIGAYLYFRKSALIDNLTRRKSLYYLNIIMIIILLSVPIISLSIQYVLSAFLFLTLILITVNKKNTATLSNDKLDYLGKISYGIYMYHPFVMFFVFPTVNYVVDSKESIFSYNVIVYFLILSLSILMSLISYKYIEDFFIKYKDRKYNVQ